MVNIFKKQKKEEIKEYQEQKKALEENNVVEKTQVGTNPKTEQPKEKEMTIGDAVIGMTDVEYRAQVLALLMEIAGRLRELENEG